MRVLHVVGDLELGGGQKLAAFVVRALDRERFDVAVLSLGATSGYGQQLISDGIDVTSLRLVQPLYRNRPRDLLRALFELCRILFSGHWDVVHTHMFSSALVVAPLARLSGARVYGTAHRVYYPRFQPALEYLLSFLNERIVVDSHAVREILRQRTHIRASKYQVIYNCVDRDELAAAPTKARARAELGVPARAKVVMEIAHLRPHKGQRHLLHAAATIATRQPDLRLLLVGGGPDEHLLREMVSDLGLNGTVMMLGPRPDLATLLAAADVLALPSEYEGFGIVQAEAMFLELPVVATSSGGSMEVVEDGVTGFLVPFGDVELLADRLGTLLSDSALRRAMGTAGKERVERLFSMEALGAAYAEMYQQRTGG